VTGVRSALGGLLHDLRKKAGFTQIQLGKAIKLSGARVSEIERGVFTGAVDEAHLRSWLAACATRIGAADADVWAERIRQAHHAVLAAADAERDERHRRPVNDAADDRRVQSVAEHTAWKLADWHARAADFREQAVALAARLAAVRHRVSGDPWDDERLVDRMTERVSWLTGRVFTEEARLSPAEAAILALAPLIQQAFGANLIASNIHVGPTVMDGDGDETRRSYLTFLEGHRLLVSRAADRAEIGWWLFHQWLAARTAAGIGVPALPALSPDGERTSILRVITNERAQGLIRALHLSPKDLLENQRLRLPESEHYFGTSTAEQHVRWRLLARLLAVAYAMAIDPRTLSSVVVEHLGIPRPVDLERLLTEVDGAEWAEDSPPGTRTLHVFCHHEAVYDALTDHVAGVDRLLKDIHLKHRAPADLSRLPTAAYSFGIQPASDLGGEPVFTLPGVRCGLDDTRIRELLMGEELYKDSGLAIRELYQNALDACRYREARHDYRRHAFEEIPPAWTGQIDFYQGIDDQERHYLDCIDNGVGMGETELRTVFSQAGARFTDQAEFMEEQADWAAHDIRFQPNSRFGIGVMSYFMLADEIEIYTRRVNRTGGYGPRLRVSIVGPGHFFRIEKVSDDGPIGTRIRLYLRDGAAAPSCATELRKVLGVAEYTTTARHGGTEERWLPGVLRTRERPAWESFGLNAHGAVSPAPPAADGQVFWCEGGGGILVDGLLADPRTLSRELGDRPLGAVVNLIGATARLSIDRLSIVNDVSSPTLALLREAIPALVEAAAAERPIKIEWLSRVGRESPAVADAIVAWLNATGGRLTLSGAPYASAAGCFPADAQVPHLRSQWRLTVSWRDSETLLAPIGGTIPDHLLLWRLAAHGMLADLLGDAAVEAESLLTAMPTDVTLLTSFFEGSWISADEPLTPGHILNASAEIGRSPRSVATRLVDLGATGVDPRCLPDLPPDPAHLMRMIVRSDGRPNRWMNADEVMSLGSLLSGYRDLGKGLREVGAEMTSLYGLSAPELGDTPDRPTEEHLRILSVDIDGAVPWLDDRRPVPPGHIAVCADRLERDVEIVRNVLRAYGLTAGPVPTEIAVGDGELLSVNFDRQRPWLPLDRPVPTHHLLKATARMGDVRSRFTAYGLVLPGDLTIDRISEDDLRFARNRFAPGEAWISSDHTVSPSHLLAVADDARLSVGLVAERLGRLGYRVHGSVDELGRHPLDRDFFLVAGTLRAFAAPTEPLPLADLIDRVIRVNAVPRAVAARLALFGYDVPDALLHLYEVEAEDVKLLAEATKEHTTTRPVSLGDILRTSERFGRPVSEVADRLRELGADVPELSTLIHRALARMPRR
jgi:transcriptional regulator with XRE-family HTH domain